MKTKAKLLVSACLLGRPCRYDGRSCPSDAVSALSDRAEWVPVCPEVMGGLPTPRVPCERQKEGGILAKDGNWRTEEYRKGAEEAVRIARENGCRAALLKEKSPSCGVHCIYDGSFGGRLIPGMGLAAEYLRAAGIAVYSETDLPDKAEEMFSVAAGGKDERGN